jgi:hypothetical protein
MTFFLKLLESNSIQAIKFREDNDERNFSVNVSSQAQTMDIVDILTIVRNRVDELRLRCCPQSVVIGRYAVPTAQHVSIHQDRVRSSAASVPDSMKFLVQGSRICSFADKALHTFDLFNRPRFESARVMEDKTFIAGEH